MWDQGFLIYFLLHFGSTSNRPLWVESQTVSSCNWSRYFRDLVSVTFTIYFPDVNLIRHAVLRVLLFLSASAGPEVSSSFSTDGRLLPLNRSSDTINFIIYQAVLIYMHYQRENVSITEPRSPIP